MVVAVQVDVGLRRLTAHQLLIGVKRRLLLIWRIVVVGHQLVRVVVGGRRCLTRVAVGAADYCGRLIVHVGRLSLLQWLLMMIVAARAVELWLRCCLRFNWIEIVDGWY